MASATACLKLAGWFAGPITLVEIAETSSTSPRCLACLDYPDHSLECRARTGLVLDLSLALRLLGEQDPSQNRTMAAEFLLYMSQDRHTREIPLQSVPGPYQTCLTAFLAPSYALYGESLSPTHPKAFEHASTSRAMYTDATGSRNNLPAVSHGHEPTGHPFRRTQHGS
jgi:hypothetical protein